MATCDRQITRLLFQILLHMVTTHKLTTFCGRSSQVGEMYIIWISATRCQEEPRKISRQVDKNNDICIRISTEIRFRKLKERVSS